MEPPIIELSQQFYLVIFNSEQGAEPILVTDHAPSDPLQRLFLVRYTIGLGAGGESGRPIFKSELTGYDHEMKLTYPTQRERLEDLQSIMESFMYASTETILSRIKVRNLSTGNERQMKAIISEELFLRLVGLYGYAW
jgi:hypothetical protein